MLMEYEIKSNAEEGVGQRIKDPRGQAIRAWGLAFGSFGERAYLLQGRGKGVW